MNRSVLTHTVIAVTAVTAAAAVLLSGTALGATHARAAGGVIHACVDKATKDVRIVSGGCHTGERAVAWNKRGPRGLRGPTGHPGATNRFAGHKAVPVGQSSVVLFDVPMIGAHDSRGGTFGFTLVLTDGISSASVTATGIFLMAPGEILTQVQSGSTVAYGTPLDAHVSVTAGPTGPTGFGVKFTVPSGFTPTKQYVDFSIDPDFASPAISLVP